MLLAGFFVGSVFFVRLGDFIGRRLLILVSTLISTFALVGCQWFSSTVLSLLFFIFLFGITIGPRCFLSYVLVLEMTPKVHHNKYCILAMFVDALCMVMLGSYFYFVKTMTGAIVSLICIQVCLLGAIWGFVPESPRFLYEKGKIEEFKKSLIMIARVNGKQATEVIACVEQVRNLG